MDVPAFPCDYLGFKSLSKPATSVAALQNPIKDLYFHFRKGLQQGTPHARSNLRVTPKGMLVSVVESSGPVDMFFDINTVNLLESVRFAVVNEKKHKAQFVPLQDVRGPSNDKAAFSVEKPFQFLLQGGHQPLLVCVLRRPKGVKAMDCHVFAMDNPETVLHVQALALHASNPQANPAPVGGVVGGVGGGGGGGAGGDYRGGTRGDFIRTEFGEYNVYRGGGQSLELRDEHFRSGEGGGGGPGGGGGYQPPGQSSEPPGPDPGGRQPNLRETYPADSGERPRFGWSYEPPPQGGGGGEEFRRGEGPYEGQDLRSPRGMGPGMGPGGPGMGPGGPGMGPGGAGMGPGGPPPGMVGMRSSGGPYQGDPRYGGGQYPPDMRSSADGRFGQYPGERRSAEIKDPDFRGSGSFDIGGYQPERRDTSHVRERSGDSGDGRLGVGRGGPPGAYQESWQYSPRSEVPPSALGGGGDRPKLSPANSLPLPSGQASQQQQQRSSGHQPLSPRTSSTGGGGVGGGHQPLSVQTSGGYNASPRTPTSPYSPTSPPGGPVYSLSNRESRGEVAAEVQTTDGKPVAKVPPHMKGVKVLPSDFLAVKLKPKPNRSMSEDSANDYDNPPNATAQYKLLQQQEAQRLEKAKAYNQNWNDDDPQSPGKPGGGYAQDPQYRRGGGGGGEYVEDERRYIEQYSDGDVQLRHGGGGDPYNSGPARHSAPDYALDAAKDSWQGDHRAHSAQYGGGMGGHTAPYPGAQQVFPVRGGAPPQGRSNGAPSSSASDEGNMGRKKDAEIANMFSNFRMQERQPVGPDNFEDSLGYLP